MFFFVGAERALGGRNPPPVMREFPTGFDAVAKDADSRIILLEAPLSLTLRSTPRDPPSRFERTRRCRMIPIRTTEPCAMAPNGLIVPDRA